MELGIKQCHCSNCTIKISFVIKTSFNTSLLGARKRLLIPNETRRTVMLKIGMICYS